MSKIKFLLGIDGGGTKTEFLLTDTDGNEIRRIILGASNPVNIGIGSTCNILKQGIDEICSGINYREVSAFAGIAGGSSENIRTEIRKLLSGFGFGAFENAGDTDSAVRAALKNENGVAVIMGTGIVAFGSLNGNLNRSGGRGYMIDKGGSGFSYGSDALNAAFGAIDGRGGSELILSLIEKKLKKPLASSVADIYEKGPGYVASFAPVVFEAYESGDKTAGEIIERNTNEAAKIIRAACGDSDKKRGNIVIIGGLSRQQDTLLPFIKKNLGDKFSVRFSDESAVNGAVSIAKSIIKRL